MKHPARHLGPLIFYLLGVVVRLRFENLKYRRLVVYSVPVCVKHNLITIHSTVHVHDSVVQRELL
jgi:hypothetical protein